MKKIEWRKEETREREREIQTRKQIKGSKSVKYRK